MRETTREAQAAGIPTSFQCDAKHLRADSEQFFIDIDVDKRAVQKGRNGDVRILSRAEMEELDDEFGIYEPFLVEIKGDRLVIASEASPIESMPLPFDVRGDVITFTTSAPIEVSMEGVVVKGSASGTLNTKTGALHQTGHMVFSSSGGSASVEMEISSICAQSS
ncbi:hypothetical protein [Rhodosalinus sediminis]|uniref:hypothetical protein n=1 Tax=Rhodosalinus sediminis TaxID=1940533 RepID=UPI0013146B3C|nr:hypothetical protein [Rhodosalinus sediminis]